MSPLPVNLLFGNTGSGVTLVLFWVCFVGFVFATRLATTLETWVLSLWARQYELQDPRDVSVR